MTSNFIECIGNILKTSVGNNLRKPRYRDPLNKFKGHCYVASEALYHLIGGKSAGWTPQFIRHEGEPHWFLKHKNGTILDVTSLQFKTNVPYDKAIGKGFLTKAPSKRAQIIISIVKEDDNARRN